MSVVRVGQRRLEHGQLRIVLRRERGLSGEARTLYVLADERGHPQSTRTLAYVRGLPLKDSISLSALRDLVRPISSKLVNELTLLISGGESQSPVVGGLLRDEMFRRVGP